MPRARESDDTPEDEDDLNDEQLALIESYSRGSFVADGRQPHLIAGHTYHRVPKEIALTLRGDRVVSVPRHDDPFGINSNYAKTRGAFAGWSGEKRDGTFRRFPVLRLRARDFTVVDIDKQRFSEAIIPANALAIVETGRGIQVILPGRPKDWYSHPIWELQDQAYVRRSKKRGTWNLRVYDKGERGPGRILTPLPYQSEEQARKASDVIAPWLSLGGRLRSPTGVVYGGKPAKGSKIK